MVRRCSLLDQVTDFYRIQLFRHREAVSYLNDRGLRSSEVIEHMRIGYAPGRCLRGWLTQSGYPTEALRQAGLVNLEGRDVFTHRIVFPLDGNLYGRSIRGSTPHMFLPGSKGGLYAWERVRQYQEIILVESLFDYAVLWQAGFHNVTCSMGNHLNAQQFQQLCDGAQTVYLVFDSDANQSSQQAAQWMSRRLWAHGVTARRVPLPGAHDPNSFFVQGGDAHQCGEDVDFAQDYSPDLQSLWSERCRKCRSSVCVRKFQQDPTFDLIGHPRGPRMYCCWRRGYPIHGEPDVGTFHRNAEAASSLRAPRSTSQYARRPEA
jgi:hypothetical protein